MYEGWGGICKWKPKQYDPKTFEKVCAYASGKFSPIKSTIDAEIHAVINSLEKFRIYYLDKRDITLRTDCDAIVRFYGKSTDNKPSKVRWLTFVDYLTGTGVHVHIEHIDGKDNVLADSLSRLVFCSLQGHEFPEMSIICSALEEVRRQPNSLQEENLSQLILKIVKGKTQQ